MRVSGQNPPARKDFFISYNRADSRWAEWIAWQLEEEGYTVVLEAWDFLPGHNLVLERDKATKQALHTLAILSPAYLNGLYAQPEWAVAFQRDPRGEEGLLVPVLVQECEVEGFLGLVLPIHLVGKSETAARQTLLAGVTSRRAKPEVPPSFPSSLPHSVSLPAHFPGTFPRIPPNLSPRTPFCIGRDQILEETHRSLNAGVSVALIQPSERSDPSPTGNSQTAGEYVYRYQSDYHDVFWLNARSRSSLLDDFRQIARVLALPEQTSNDQQLLIAQVKNWFETHPDWLLVFDHVEDDQQMKSFLPQSNNGHILLTSRVLSPGGATRSLELPASRPEERELIQRLARTVGGSLTGPSARNVLDLYRPTTIGQAPNNTIVLNDPAVAPYHAEIRLTGQGYTLRNHDTHNRTRINNQPLPVGETRVLTPNTSIIVGNTTLLYQVGNRVQPGQGTPGFAPPRTPTLPNPSLNPPAHSPSPGLTPSSVSSWNAPMSPGYPLPIHPSPQSVPPPLLASTYASKFNNGKILPKKKRRRLWLLISVFILILLVISITLYAFLIANGFGQGSSSLLPTPVPTFPLIVAPTATPAPTPIPTPTSGVTATPTSRATATSTQATTSPQVGVGEANTFVDDFCIHLGTFPQEAFNSMSIQYRTLHTETEFQNAPFSTGQCTHDLPKIANTICTVVLHVNTANYTATIIHDPGSNEDLKVDSIQ